MNKFPSRAILFLLFLLIIGSLIFFTHSNNRVTLSIAIIMLFLIIFTYIFKTDGSKSLKALLIIFIFICLPVFILLFLGVLNAFDGPIFGILLLIVVAIVGLLSIVTIVKLDYVELKWD